MKASELIQSLQDLIAEHGDLECEDSYGEQLGEPEFSDDGDGEAVFVLADKA